MQADDGAGRSFRPTGRPFVRELSDLAALGVALALAIGAASTGHADGPAVDGTNGRISAGGGDIDGDWAGALEGTLAVPLGDYLGAQMDVAGGAVGGDGLLGAGAHLFWRDPGLGTVGTTFTYAQRFDDRDRLVLRVGVDAAYYWGPVTLRTAGFGQWGDVVQHYVGEVGAIYYPLEDLALLLGLAFVSGDDDVLHGGIEWQVGSENLQGLSLFAEGAVGSEHDYSSVLAGIRFHFNESPKPLMTRQREDFRPSLLPGGFTSLLHPQ